MSKNGTVGGRRLPLVAVAVAAMTLCVSIGAAGPTAGQTDDDGKASQRSPKVKAPPAWRAYPLNQVELNLEAQATRDACDFEARQRPGSRALLIFSLGRANERNGRYGVGSDSDFLANERVYEVLLAAGRAYDDCRGAGRKRVKIAYGVTNYKLSRSVHSDLATEVGRAQHAVTARLNRELPNGVRAVAAADIEPGWDAPGSTLAINLVHGGARPSGAYFSFGTPGQCRPFGSGCQGDWTPVDIGRVSQDAGVEALPQVYHAGQAKTWARIANLWDRAGGNCRRPRRRSCFDFGGVTGQPVGCHGTEYSPGRSWRQMRQATRRRVGRKLILWNPRRVGCGGSGRSSGAVTLRQNPEAALTAIRPIPGEIIEDPDPIVSEYEMPNLVNAWRQGTSRGLTVVYAGQAGSEGRLVISRERYLRNGAILRSIEVIAVPGAGALRITGDGRDDILRLETAIGRPRALDLSR